MNSAPSSGTSSPSFGPPQRFPGHKGPVLDIISRKNEVITTSEDNTVRLWDMRTGKTCQCFTGFGNESVNIVKYAPYNDHHLFGMTDNSVILFDMRKDGLIVRDAHTTVYSHVEDGTKEENELTAIDIHFKESLQLIALGDDNGDITLVDSQTGEVRRRLRKAHANVIGAIAFQPKSQNYICTGGFDSHFCCWDFSRGRPCGEAVDFSREIIQQQQMANPPFVHDIVYTDGEGIVIGALGDGSLRAMKYVAKRGFLPMGAISAHGGMATNLCPLSLNISSPYSDLSDRCHFISSGIDCCVKGWRISQKYESIRDSATVLIDTDVPTSKNEKKKTKKKRTSIQQRSKEEARTNNIYEFVCIFNINNDERINALACINSAIGSTSETVMVADSIFAGIAVADITTEWKLYQVKY